MAKQAGLANDVGLDTRTSQVVALVGEIGADGLRLEIVGIGSHSCYNSGLRR